VWAGIVGDCLEGPHVWPHWLTGNRQSYWKLYHWQSEHECGTRVMVLRAVRDVVRNTYHDRWTGRRGPTAWPPRLPDLNPLDLYLWGHLDTLVYAAPVDNGETLHRQTIRNCPGIFARMWRPVMRRVEACTESHGGHYEHLIYECTRTLSAVTHKIKFPDAR
jgi:hypothetical protein